MHWYGFVLIAAGALAALYLIGGFALFCYLCLPPKRHAYEPQGRWIQYANEMRDTARAMADFPHELVSIRSFDGTVLRAKLYPNEKKDRILVLAHGYHSSPSKDFGACFTRLYRAGYTILAVDMRAHGASEGKYIGFGALDQKDVRCWMDDLVKRFGKDCRIGLIGISMGAATVMLVSGGQPLPQLKCIVEDCGYTSISEVVHHIERKQHYPSISFCAVASLWCRLLAGYSFRETRAIDAVRRSTVPMLFLHGDADTFVPFSMLEPLYAACGALKEKVVFEGAAHAESSYREPDRYEKTVIGFLQQYLEPKGERTK